QGGGFASCAELPKWRDLRGRWEWRVPLCRCANGEEAVDIRDVGFDRLWCEFRRGCCAVRLVGRTTVLPVARRQVEVEVSDSRWSRAGPSRSGRRSSTRLWL